MHYSLRAFLLRLSRGFLVMILKRHAVGLDFDPTGLKKRDIEPIFVAINQLPDGARYHNSMRTFAASTTWGPKRVRDDDAVDRNTHLTLVQKLAD